MKLFSSILLAALSIGLFLPACHKMNVNPAQPLSPVDNPDSNMLVFTPAGMMPKSQIHVIEKGFSLLNDNGHMYKIQTATKKIIEDFGTFAAAVSGVTSSSGNVSTFAVEPDALTFSGPTILWAQWENTSTSPITSLTTSVTVPNNPGTIDGQTIDFTVAGLADGFGVTSTEAVMGWDASVGQWTIANWYFWGAGFAAMSTPTNVSPGTSLQAAITFLGIDANNSAHYQSSFTGLNTLDIQQGNTGLSGAVIPQVVVQADAFFAMNAEHGPGVIMPGVFQATDYPTNQSYVDIHNISVLLNGTFSSVNWTPGSQNTNFGENTVIVSNDAAAINNPFGNRPMVFGDINLYFHPVITINGSPSVGLSPAAPVACTISGFPGTIVNLSENAIMGPFRLGGTPTTTGFTITTPGVTFTGGGTSLSVTDGTVSQTFIMPASGSLTGTATLSGVGQGSVSVK